jgi:hypothetical protein
MKYPGQRGAPMVIAKVAAAFDEYDDSFGVVVLFAVAAAATASISGTSSRCDQSKR